MTTTTSNATQFETGKTYFTRSSCDWDCIYDFTITRRTAKSVWIMKDGEEVRRSVYLYDGVERFRPFGTYSMCAIISADRELA